MATNDLSPLIFEDVVFYIRQPSIDEVQTAELRQKLLSNGAREAPHMPDGIDLGKVTHIVTGDIDFKEFGECEARSVEIVTPKWVETSVQRSKQLNPQCYSPDPRMIFSGLLVTCSELPPGDRDAIYGGIKALGGEYTDKLLRTTTHIVALSANNEKCRQAMARPGLGIKIVLPHWFDDCLKLRRRIGEGPYLFGGAGEVPEICKGANLPDESLPPVPPAEASAEGKYTHADPLHLPPQPMSPFLAGRKIFLAKDWEVAPHLRQSLQQTILNAGGVPVDQVAAADVYVGQWREGDDYVDASKRDLVVGNLIWLYWMLAHTQWISPRIHLLHYPKMKGGLPHMRNMVITVSNYTGNTRTYLEQLVLASGAKFTKSMRQNENTHLITASPTGSKYEHARSWGLVVVNHLWLEETYGKWCPMSPTESRFTALPEGRNLMEVVHKTPIDGEALRQFWESEDEEESDEEEEPTTTKPLKPILAPQTSGLSSALPSDGLKDRDLTSPATAHTPTPRPRTTKLPQQTPTSRGPLTHLSSEPPSSGKRKAADAAIARLHSVIMPDVVAYEKEKRRKTSSIVEPPLPVGPKSSTPAEEQPPAKKSKKMKQAVVAEAPKKGAGNVTGRARSVSTTARPSSDIRILVTGYKDWDDTKVDELTELGIDFVSTAPECTHLAAPGILRTEKFMSAIPYAPIIISTEWLEACLADRKIADVDEYILQDKKMETQYKCKLADTLDRARKNQRTLFKGYIVHLTTGIKGGVEPSTRIIEANGGKVEIGVPSTRQLATKEEGVERVIVSIEKDRKQWDKLVKAARVKGEDPHVYSTEWILTSVLRQELAGDDEFVIKA
ncbi:regulator of Ty1 Transposition [Saitoella coloradoensis]